MAARGAGGRFTETARHRASLPSVSIASRPQPCCFTETLERTERPFGAHSPTVRAPLACAPLP